MAKKIRFPLKMKNGAEVRALDELKENFDLESVLGYFTDGKLTTWLADRYYDEKAAAVAALSTDMPDLNAKLCEILEVEYQGDDDVADLEYIQRRNEKLRILSSFTDNKDILNNIDLVAMSQDDLFDILDEQPEKVYLYGEKFSIPFGAKNVCYIGIGHEKPVIITNFDYLTLRYVFLDDYKNKYGITFKNVRYGIGIHEEVENFYNAGEYDRDFVFEVLYQSAVDGDMYDQVRVGWMYENGNGVLQDYAEAVKWYRKAAEQGDASAQFNLGYMYNKGYGVEQDKTKAVEWYRKSAEQGYAKAQRDLGYMYQNGYGVEKDYAKAVEWYRKAAEQGDASAQFNLGWMYNVGNGIDKDNVKAVEWYRKAAEQGYATAQYGLGDMYYYGNGVEKDYAKAVEWYRKAAEQGYATAQYDLGCMYYNDNGVEKEYAKAVEWYTKAAEKGHANAQYYLGRMYEQGKGVTVDKNMAITWYKKAKSNGHYDAGQKLDLLENKGISLFEYMDLKFAAISYGDRSWSEIIKAKKRLKELGPLYGDSKEDLRNYIKF
ncbi:MAG: tetratricopeptide repeat protein [Ruminococcus sp.]|nr:tetratricopeptide repeat protein [Ruminococcus sp.]